MLNILLKKQKQAVYKKHKDIQGMRENKIQPMSSTFKRHAFLHRIVQGVPSL